MFENSWGEEKAINGWASLHELRSLNALAGVTRAATWSVHFNNIV